MVAMARVIVIVQRVANSVSTTVVATTAISARTPAMPTVVEARQVPAPTVATMAQAHRQTHIHLPSNRSRNLPTTGEPIPSLTSHAPPVQRLRCKSMWRVAAATTRILTCSAIAPTVGFASPVVITVPEVGSTIASALPAI